MKNTLKFIVVVLLIVTASCKEKFDTELHDAIAAVHDELEAEHEN